MPLKKAKWVALYNIFFIVNFFALAAFPLLKIKHTLIHMRKIFYVIPLLLSLDIVTKWFAGNFFVQRVPIIWDYLFFELTRNTGVAFSFAIHGLFLKILTLVLIFGIIYYYIKEEYAKNDLLIDGAFCLVISGALWNAFERIFFGVVVDFIWVRYFSVFNLADSFLCIGVFIYCIHLLLPKTSYGKWKSIWS